MRYELVPMQSLVSAMAELPMGASVSVTCSPRKGIDATLAASEQLLAAGHGVVPHISARLFEGHEQVGRLARWIRSAGLDEIFVVGGDVPAPLGPYPDAAALLRELLSHDTGLRAIGFAAYPDGHGFIGRDDLHAALHTKQELLADAAIDGWATTQMCFDTGRMAEWLRTQRDGGLVLPIHVGIPGSVDRTQLMKMGLRLGVGSSLSYLRKNRAVVGRLLGTRRYDPTPLVLDIGAWATSLGVTGLHSFTFNQVETTRHWQERFAT
ncbi:MAG: hypothetical protein ACR2QE_09150 [Acidimicrobiales bacterium]